MSHAEGGVMTILSDIDGVIRNLYEALYKSYKEDIIYNEYVAYTKFKTHQRSTPISYEEFLDIIYNPEKQTNSDLIMSLIERHPEVYAIAQANEKIIWAYDELISSGVANGIEFLTTYINDHTTDATNWWLRKYLKIPADKWHVTFCKNGIKKKIVPKGIIESDDAFLIVEDSEYIGRDIADQIKESNKLAELVIVSDKLPSAAIEIIRTALHLYQEQYGHEFGRN
jgi:hypothetical protein